jgi:two-component system, cell cycle sensor histidine kinase and response regulator CckA
VRTLTSQVLELEGYSVLTASSGSEAIERFYKSQKPIELLVADVVMPDMNGLDLARELQQRAPDLRVLYVSGYLNDHVLPQMKLGRQSFFLAKPFLPQEFVGKVREILDAPGEREIYRAS